MGNCAEEEIMQQKKSTGLWLGVALRLGRREGFCVVFSLDAFSDDDMAGWWLVLDREKVWGQVRAKH